MNGLSIVVQYSRRACPGDPSTCRWEHVRTSRRWSTECQGACVWSCGTLAWVLGLFSYRPRTVGEVMLLLRRDRCAVVDPGGLVVMAVCGGGGAWW